MKEGTADQLSLLTCVHQECALGSQVVEGKAGEKLTSLVSLVSLRHTHCRFSDVLKGFLQFLQALFSSFQVFQGYAVSLIMHSFMSVSALVFLGASFSSELCVHLGGLVGPAN